VEAQERLEEGWNHLAGVLGEDKSLRLYVNGSLAATGKAPGLVATEPAQALELGADSGGAVGNYQSPYQFAGTIDEVRIFHRALSAEDITQSTKDPEQARDRNKEAVLALSFDAGNAKDLSGNKNDGELGSLPTGQGKLGAALVFPRTSGNAQPAKTGFEHSWTRFAPVFARSMLLAKDQLVLAGPPDDVDSEYALERLAAKDKAIHEQLKLQDENLQGKHGAKLWVMDTRDGTQLTELQLDSLPVWDGMSAAYGKVYISTIDGKVICLGK
jgi:hypothetical protein